MIRRMIVGRDVKNLVSVNAPYSGKTRDVKEDQKEDPGTGSFINQYC